MKIRTLAPAKINLYLEIGKKRKDGYHNLETIFQTVSLYDEITIDKKRVPSPLTGEGGGEGEISLKLLPVSAAKSCPENSKNLVWRAAYLFLKKFSIPGSVKILLKKKIPVCAGLGGGSSDASAALKALSQIEFPNSQKSKFPVLNQIAFSLGADVPFFLQGGCAFASGIGEKIRPLPAPQKFWCVIVKPALGLSTAEVYRWLDQDNLKGAPKNGLTPRRNLNKILYLINRKKPAEEWSQYIYNSFEKAVYKRVSMLAQLKDKIIQYGAWNACLSGSGSALFGIVSSQFVGEKIKQKLKGAGREIWVVHSV